MQPCTETRLSTHHLRTPAITLQSRTTTNKRHHKKTYAMHLVPLDIFARLEFFEHGNSVHVWTDWLRKLMLAEFCVFNSRS